jgi:hypothetical protein
MKKYNAPVIVTEHPDADVNSRHPGKSDVNVNTPVTAGDIRNFTIKLDQM